MRQRGIICILSMLTLTGCTVGPAFHSPREESHASDVYLKPTSDSVVPASPTTRQIDLGGAPKQQWWRDFESPIVDALIDQAVAHSPTWAAATATLAQAAQTLQAQTGEILYPRIDATLSATDERAFLFSPKPTQARLYNVGIDVSYTVDVFGAGRRQREADEAAFEYQQFQTEAAYEILIGNTLTAYFTACSLKGQVEATQRIVAAEREELGVITQQRDLGAVSDTTYLQQTTLVAQSQAQLAALQLSLAKQIHQFAVLIGAPPEGSNIEVSSLDALTVPQNLPVSLPSSLTRRRPDVRASEASLHQATAALGVATANLFPQVTLTAAYQRERIDFAVGNASADVWNLGSGLTQPLFHGGALRAQRRAALAARDAAESNYRDVVLKAMQSVADALRAIESDDAVFDADARAAKSAADLVTIEQEQYRSGATRYLDLLDAQRSYEQAQVARVAARAARLTDVVALYVALGGSWREPEPKSSTAGVPAPATP